MTKIVHALFVCLLFSNFSQAQTNPEKIAQSEATAKEVRGAATEPAASLPVRRVVLYKNGVGYFEHLGRVRGNQTVHVDFTSAQLNDVLKSLRSPASTTTPKPRWPAASPHSASPSEKNPAWLIF